MIALGVEGDCFHEAEFDEFTPDCVLATFCEGCDWRNPGDWYVEETRVAGIHIIQLIMNDDGESFKFMSPIKEA